MKKMIHELMAAGHRVTCHDDGDGETANFVLAVVLDEPIDVWYIAHIVGADKYMAETVGNLLVFPELTINKEIFEFICAEDHDPV